MQLHKVQCPACGGPLEIAAGQQTIRCAFCGATATWNRLAAWLEYWSAQGKGLPAVRVQRG